MYEIIIVLSECSCLAPKRMGAACGSVMVKMDCYEQAAIIVAGGQNEDKSISRYGFISNPIYLKTYLLTTNWNTIQHVWAVHSWWWLMDQGTQPASRVCLWRIHRLRRRKFCFGRRHRLQWNDAQWYNSTDGQWICYLGRSNGTSQNILFNSGIGRRRSMLIVNGALFATF